jgi:hypothetical protein
MFLDILPDDNDFKIKWSLGAQEWCYPVDRARILERGEAVRVALERLADWFGSNDAIRRRNLLADLASAGADFEDELFNSPNRVPEIRRLRAWLRDEFENDKTLQIKSPSSLQVPWGLVYSADAPSRVTEKEVEENPEILDIPHEREVFAAFWCLAYDLNITQGAFRRSRKKMLRPRSSFGLLTLLNSDVEKQIHRQEKGCERQEAGLFAGAARCHSECLSMIATTKCTDVIFYFLGHHDDAELELGGGEKITERMFRRLMERLADKIMSADNSCGLVFLNGCKSAAGHNTNLRYYTEREELCGVIATECKVPIPFAHALGIELLDLLMHGKSVGSAMRSIYGNPDRWPLCLVYGCYANPLYEIEQANCSDVAILTPTACVGGT